MQNNNTSSDSLLDGLLIDLTSSSANTMLPNRNDSTQGFVPTRRNSTNTHQSSSNRVSVCDPLLVNQLMAERDALRGQNDQLWVTLKQTRQELRNWKERVGMELRSTKGEQDLLKIERDTLQDQLAQLHVRMEASLKRQTEEQEHLTGVMKERDIALAEKRNLEKKLSQLPQRQSSTMQRSLDATGSSDHHDEKLQLQEQLSNLQATMNQLIKSQQERDDEKNVILLEHEHLLKENQKLAARLREYQGKNEDLLKQVEDQSRLRSEIETISEQKSKMEKTLVDYQVKTEDLLKRQLEKERVRLSCIENRVDTMTMTESYPLTESETLNIFIAPYLADASALSESMKSLKIEEEKVSQRALMSSAKEFKSIVSANEEKVTKRDLPTSSIEDFESVVSLNESEKTESTEKSEGPRNAEQSDRSVGSREKRNSRRSADITSIYATEEILPPAPKGESAVFLKQEAQTADEDDIVFPEQKTTVSMIHDPDSLNSSQISLVKSFLSGNATFDEILSPLMNQSLTSDTSLTIMDRSIPKSQPSPRKSGTVSERASKESMSIKSIKRRNSYTNPSFTLPPPPLDSPAGKRRITTDTLSSPMKRKIPNIKAESSDEEKSAVQSPVSMPSRLRAKSDPPNRKGSSSIMQRDSRRNSLSISNSKRNSRRLSTAGFTPDIPFGSIPLPGGVRTPQNLDLQPIQRDVQKEIDEVQKILKAERRRSKTEEVKSEVEEVQSQPTVPIVPKIKPELRLQIPHQPVRLETPTSQSKAKSEPTISNNRDSSISLMEQQRLAERQQQASPPSSAQVKIPLVIDSVKDIPLDLEKRIDILELVPILKTDVLTSVIRLNDRQKEYTAYIISVGTHRGELWRLEKRYSDFLQLHAQLRRTQPPQTMAILSKKQPKKNVFDSSQNLAPSKADERRTILHDYIQLVLKETEDDCYEILKFLASDLLEFTNIRSTQAFQQNIKEGYLVKKGRHFGGWKRRYFCLNDDHLDYYETKELAVSAAQSGAGKDGRPSTRPTGTIDLRSARIARPMDTEDDSDFRHSFAIIEYKNGVEGHRSVLCAESDYIRDEWVDLISKQVKAVFKEEESMRMSDNGISEPLQTLAISDPIVTKPSIGDLKTVTRESTPAPKSNALFGIPLVAAVDRAPAKEGYRLPAVVLRCIEFLDQNEAYKEEGLYRINGDANQVSQLRMRFENKGDIDLIRDPIKHDVHVVASLLKQYLRELPDSILTSELHRDFLHVTDLLDRSDRITEAAQLVSRLPIESYTLLRVLMSHLMKTIEHSDVNKMTARNMGMIFSATLGIPVGVFALMLTEFEFIFWVNENPEKTQTESERLPAPARVSSIAKDQKLKRRSWRPDEVIVEGRSKRNSQLYEKSAPETLRNMERNVMRHSLASQVSSIYAELSDIEQTGDDYSMEYEEPPMVQGKVLSSTPKRKSKKKVLAVEVMSQPAVSTKPIVPPVELKTPPALEPRQSSLRDSLVRQKKVSFVEPKSSSLRDSVSSINTVDSVEEQQRKKAEAKRRKEKKLRKLQKEQQEQEQRRQTQEQSSEKRNGGKPKATSVQRQAANPLGI